MTKTAHETMPDWPPSSWNSGRDHFGKGGRLRWNPHCSIGITPGLNEDVEHNTILIDSAPKIVLNALDPDKDFVYMPFVSRLWPAGPRGSAKLAANFLHQRRTVS